MIDSHYPSADELVRDQRTRLRFLTILLIVTVIAVFGITSLWLYYFQWVTANVAWLIGLAAFIVLTIPVAIWNNPRCGIYLLAAGAVLFGGQPGAEQITIPTTYVPFWINISIIGQHYGTAALNGIAVSPGEVIIILTAISWLIRATMGDDLRIRGGPIAIWILAYVGAVTAGFILGMVRGGDMIAGLWEVRAQFHFLAAFILAANLITERAHAVTILWVLVICTGLQGIFGAITYFSLGQEVSEQGIMAHDDSMLFNLLFFTFFLACMAKVSRKLMLWSLVLIPTALISVMANQRRAGIGAFIVAFLPLIPILWVILKERRLQIFRFGVVFAAISAVYLPLTWNMQGPWGLPARALRSNTSPSERDAASNYYRMVEDENLKYTRDLNPWTGKGYGRPFAKIVVLPEIQFPMKDYFPHNSILWVWMNIGHPGFFCFLMMFAAVCIYGLQQLNATSDSYVKVVGVMAVVDMLMLFIYGKYDLQLVNPRQMVLGATLVGILSVLSQIKAPAESREESAWEEAPALDARPVQVGEM